MRLCGISSRFQLLSPSVRQVAHALLTRPPLSHKILQSEEIRFKCFVRLACVKHAASVHPEPGSNSLKKCLFQVLDNCLANSFFTVVCTPDDHSSEYKKKLFKRIFKVVSLLNCQCAFFCSALLGGTSQLYHAFRSLSTVFLTKQKKRNGERGI